MKLHEAKMKCFLPLSKGTTEEEKKDFAAYDIETEIIKTTDRFADHPEEIEENAPKIESVHCGLLSGDRRHGFSGDPSGGNRERSGRKRRIPPGVRGLPVEQ